jgi:hypothetical protein
MTTRKIESVCAKCFFVVEKTLKDLDAAIATPYTWFLSAPCTTVFVPEIAKDN